MYTYGIDKRNDALKHVFDQGSDIYVGLGDAILSWDTIYGCVNEYQDGLLVTRHYPVIDYESWDGKHFSVRSWSSKVLEVKTEGNDNA